MLNFVFVARRPRVILPPWQRKNSAYPTVNDLNASKFTANARSRSPAHRSPRVGARLSQGARSEELIEICHFPGSGPVQVQPDLTHLAFEVDDLAAFAQHLAKFGLQYSDPPHVREDGSGFAFLDAPEGYEIELMQRGTGGKTY